MDIVTLAMAKPKIVDLTEFKVGDGRTINDVMVTLMTSSIQSGTLQSLETELPDSALRDACSVNRQLVIKIKMLSDDILVPTSVDTFDGRMGQISASCMMELGGVGVVDTKALIDFHGDTILSVYVKSVVLS